MITPGKLDLVAQRWTPFLYRIAFEGFDFAAGTFAMQVRLYRDAPGDPLLSLTNALSSAQGLSATVDTVGENEAEMVVSTVQLRINETTIEALLPFPGSGVKAGATVSLFYDLVITGGGLPKTRWLQGFFNIEPGVTV